MINKDKLLLIIITLVVIGFFAFYQYNNQETEPTNNELKEVLLYFSTSDAMYLKAEKRMVKADHIYLNTLKELIKGPESNNLNPTIPEGVEILDLRVKDGIAYIDFNRALKDNHWGGSTGESMTVYSIVNTMTQFPEIEKVQFMLEGEKIETLAGHIYLMPPIEPNKRLLKQET
ncbi:GerMN domain-containing protein [Halothermothrix orenii]|uniref:GerMN domain-containing protein n=1 Tax=Halothermothrix orenii (strain H 168 / OCM 544 / DSM 9562) TaxID=373903 RepID=B8CYD0_HALOH|nr:GerMN domain-containing protein [Halothermothrix orenii]ACL70299.1 hypothetical protein Hore_15500 [Halothermothrix orenii H 168]